MNGCNWASLLYGVSFTQTESSTAGLRQSSRRQLPGRAGTTCCRRSSAEGSPSPPFMKNRGALVHPLATEIWSTPYSVSVRESDLVQVIKTHNSPRLARMGAFSAPVGVPAGSCGPWCPQADSAAMGSGTLVIMPTCGKAAQRPQLINMEI